MGMKKNMNPFILIISTLFCSCGSSNIERKYLLEGESRFIKFEVDQSNEAMKERNIDEVVESKKDGDTLFLTFRFQNNHVGYFEGNIDDSMELIEFGLNIKKEPSTNKTKYGKGVYYLKYTYLNSTGKEYNKFLGYNACEIYNACEY